jgi:glycerol-3-phosphate dehydrogenase (NAD(P)+)
MDEVYAVLYKGKSPKEALRELLGRDPRPEAG